MEYYFNRNMRKKKRLLRRWLEQKEEYQDFTRTVKILKLLLEVLLGIWMMAVAVYIIQQHSQEWIFLKGLWRLFVGFMAFLLLRYGLKRLTELGKAELGSPYYQRQNEFLRIVNNEVFYGYQDKSIGEKSMMIYRIPIYSIRSHEYNENTGEMVIVGAGNFDIYEDYKKRRKKEKKIYLKHNSPFVFLYCFDELEEFQKRIEAYKIL